MGPSTRREAAEGRAGGPRRRADAERNIAAIVTAATDLLARDPDASMTDIARAAGVGRVTLYAHFPSREELVRTVLAAAIGHSMGAVEAAAPGEGPPAEAFARLIRRCWPILDRFGSLHEAARRALPAEEVRRHHDLPMGHVERLIVRGQEVGSFRADLPAEWLVTTVYALLHAAGDEVQAGRRTAEETEDLLERTLSALLRTPDA
jgi:TetR/AcrR family transcriptional regulator, mexCD-oprJ operon repressor